MNWALFVVYVVFAISIVAAAHIPNKGARFIVILSLAWFLAISLWMETSDADKLCRQIVQAEHPGWEAKRNGHACEARLPAGEWQEVLDRP